MAEEKKIATGLIGNALRSSAADHTTTFADEIFDTERQKYQNEVNTDLETTDNEIKADLEAEISRATAAEQANAQAIVEETNRAEQSENSILSKIGIDFSVIISEASNIKLPTITKEVEAVLRITGITESATLFLYKNGEDTDYRSYFGDTGVISKDGTYTTTTKIGQNVLRVIPQNGDNLNITLYIKVQEIHKEVEGLIEAETENRIIAINNEAQVRTNADDELSRELLTNDSVISNEIRKTNLNIFEHSDILDPIITKKSAYIGLDGAIVSGAESRRVDVYRLNQGETLTLRGSVYGGAVLKYAIYKDINLSKVLLLGEIADGATTGQEISTDQTIAYLAVSSLNDNGNISMFVYSEGFKASDIYRRVFGREKYIYYGEYSEASITNIDLEGNRRCLLFISGISSNCTVFLFNSKDGSSFDYRSYFQPNGVIEKNGIYETTTKDLQDAIRIIPQNNDTVEISLILLDNAYSINNSTDRHIVTPVSESTNIPFDIIDGEYKASLKISGIKDRANVYIYNSKIKNSFISRSYFGQDGIIYEDGEYEILTKKGQNALRIITSSKIDIDFTISNSPISQEVGKIIDSKRQECPYTEFFSIWDSLGSQNIWQNKLSEITGLKFDTEVNSIMSVGGRWILDEGYSDKCAFYATKYLVENYKSRADNAIIFLENVHDYLIGSIDDLPYFVQKAYDYVDICENRDAALQLLLDDNFKNIIATKEATIGATIVVTYGTLAEVLSIDIMPSEGNFYVIEQENGEEVDRYGVNVSSSDSKNDILTKISVYEYKNYVASVSDNTVIFNKKTTNASSISVEANGTGINYSISKKDLTNKIGRAFLSKDVSEWNDISKWAYNGSLSLYSKLKGQIEFLQKNLPHAKIYFVAPTYSIIRDKAQSPEMYYPDGSFNVDYWKKSGNNSNYSGGNWGYQNLIAALKAVGEIYGIETIDIMNNVGISPINWQSYYALGNSHPIMINGEYPAYNLWANYIKKFL